MIIRKNHFSMFNEVDMDGQPAGDPNINDDDYTANDDTPDAPPPDDNSTPEAGDSTPNPEAGGENPPPEDPGQDDMDFTQGTDDPAGGEEDPYGGEGGDQGAAPPAGGDAQVTADDARGMEQELFQDLTPDQIDLKHKELKNNFLELYNSTANIVDRVNEIPTSDKTVAAISFVGRKLGDLRTMIADYMNDVYSTKSYMENAINYNRFLAALSGINQILDKINEEIVNKDNNVDDR